MEEILISNNQYPPGIRFQPSDVELISYYLDRKVKDLPLPANVITDIDLYTFDPWDLPRKTVCGEDELYFFTPRNRKYPKGGRPNRAAASGYWKATATDQPVFHGSTKIGVKKGLVFYQGKPPNGRRTDWTMTEYRLPGTSRPSRSSTGSMRLDDWVLCRIRRKGNMSKNENVKEPPSVCGRDCRDMLTDYLQSNEYNVTVSLLAGHDPAALSTPTAISPRHKNDKSSRAIRADASETQQNFYLFQSFSHSESSQAKEQISYGDIQLPSSNMIRNEQSGPLVATEGNKCKPRYPSNACITLQELHMLPALQENFLQ